MNTTQERELKNVLHRLHKDSENDFAKIALNAHKSIFRPLRPEDFKDAYLPISAEQGKSLKELILKSNSQQVVEFGTSFGISTIYLAEAVKITGGQVVTTELLESKVNKAKRNVSNAGLIDYVDFRVGDAMETLSEDTSTIDFLFLDGWKDLYLPLFQMLESRFHSGTLIYADNIDMPDTKPYTNYINQNSDYQTKFLSEGKASLTKLI